MAETATRPAARKRAAAPAKPAVKAAAPTAAAEPAVTTDGDETRLVLTLDPHPQGATKGYSRWVFPDASGCVGTVYAPLGATSVKVAVVGPAK